MENLCTKFFKVVDGELAVFPDADLPFGDLGVSDRLPLAFRGNESAPREGLTLPNLLTPLILGSVWVSSTETAF
jgi:hypothetical protein